MTQLSLILPEPGKPDKTEDLKIGTAFTTIQNWANGNIDATNIKEGVLTEALMAPVKSSIIETEEEVTSSTYRTMPTPDQVTITLPNNGLIAVAYQASWFESVASAARASLYLGGNAVKVSVATAAGPYNNEARVNSNTYATILSTCANGLASAASPGESFANPGTTGTALGGLGLTTYMNGEVGAGIPGGPCYIFAAAGTYAVSVQFKVSSGNVKCRRRKLWAWGVF